MFGFGRKKKKEQDPAVQGQEEQPRKKTRTDKIVMGAILGVAIGSVISMSLLPKKKDNGKKNNSGAKRDGKRFSLFRKAKKGNGSGISENPRKIPTEFE